MSAARRAGSSKAPAGAAALDIVTWGETMVRLSTPPGVPLEDARALDLAVGGAESNLAIACARLGRRVGWVSRLPDNALGRRIARDLAAHGVDTSRVLWADGAEQAGLYFIESGTPPRANTVLYARRDSALARLAPDALPLDYLASARVLHLTGITPALGEGCRAAWLVSAQRARAAGAHVSLDVNYRAKLWTPAEARRTLEAAFPHTSVLFSGLRDLRLLFDAPAEPERAARALATAYDLPLVVVTLGAEGALAFDAQAEVLVRAPAVPTQVVDRIGAGDAFAAGFLHGWLEGGDLTHGLRCGNALAALKQTWRGDTSWATSADLDALLAADGTPDARRVDR